VLTDFSVKNIKATFGEKSTSYSNVNRDFILDLGYMHAGEQVTLAGEDQKIVSVNIYRLLEGNYTEAMAQLREQPLVVTSYSDTQIQATIDVQKDGILFTSIPYEEGWTVYVDGIPAETKAFANAFVSIDLSAGQHNITMSYMPVGLKEGAVISLASLLILMIVILVYLIRHRKAKRQEAADRSEMRIPVAESAQARPSAAPSQSDKLSYADRIRPADESMRRKEFQEPTVTEDEILLGSSEEIPADMISPTDSIQETITTDAEQDASYEEETATLETATVLQAYDFPSVTPDEEIPAQPTSSSAEKNPRLLAFEQLMKDLGGRIE